MNNNLAGVTKSLEPVEEVVAEAVLRLKKRIPNANITLKVPDEFLMIPMDATLIEQVPVSYTHLLSSCVFFNKTNIKSRIMRYHHAIF